MISNKLIILLIPILIALILINPHPDQHSNIRDKDESNIKGYNIIGQVETVHLDKDVILSAYIPSHYDYPVVVRHDIVSHWRLTTKWTTTLNMISNKLIILLIPILIALILINPHPDQHSNIRDKDESNIKGYNIIGQVETVHLDKDVILSAYIPSHYDYPVVVRHDIVSHWRLTTKWTWEFLAEYFVNDFLVMLSPSNLFVYYDMDKPFGDFIEDGVFSGKKRDIYFELDKMETFLEKQKRDVSWFRYLSQPVPFAEWVEEGDADGWESLLVDDDTENYTVNFWVGRTGIVTQTHFDESYNFFYQVRGRKKFILSHPSNYDKVVFFPHLHPSSRQSQMLLKNDLSYDVSNTKFPKIDQLNTIDAYEVILEPGDLLYLPPFWLHHVITLEDSISLTFWSQNDLPAESAFLELPLPIESEWSEEKQITALSSFFKALIKLNFENETKFWDLLHTQYTSYFGRSTNSKYSYCSSPEYEQWKSEKEKEYLSENHIEQLTQIINSHLTEPHIKQDSISSYIETVLSFLYGAQNTNEIIQHCLK
eukprot:TRINITY_DN6819_c0_g1_i1.p1 TRINITY_DN6819_c0_g1~~TRINITY_DN6819_c0_g1_i1.p1  ORF type:complete len:551 (+),score=101.05 TRINITY_DN6819_c0_g1_i1:37-1653(+)